MADFRSVQTRMWREDEWFMDLPTDARLFWIYLFTNPSASICGMYRLPPRTMSFESGLSHERVLELLDQFTRAGKIAYEDGVIWVVRMRDNQLGDKLSKTQRIGIIKDMAKIPPSPLKDHYLDHYGYPIGSPCMAPGEDDEGLDSLCIGRATLRYDTVTDTLRHVTSSEPMQLCSRTDDENDDITNDHDRSLENSEGVSPKKEPVKRNVTPMKRHETVKTDRKKSIDAASGLFNTRVHMITGGLPRDELEELAGTLFDMEVPGWFEMAIDAAEAAGARNWAYVRACIKNAIREKRPPSAKGKGNGANFRGGNRRNPKRNDPTPEDIEEWNNAPIIEE